MAKFCGKCGTQINDNAMFCGRCGAKVEVANAAYYPMATSNAAPNTPNKLRWVLSMLGQLVCVALFFLPTINLEAFWVDEDVSIIELISEAGYSPIYVILLIFVAVLVMILLILQGKPFKANGLMFMQIMFVLFFVVNVTFYVVIGNKVKDQGLGIVEYNLNPWGWIYVIMSVITIIDLRDLSSKIKKELI